MKRAIQRRFRSTRFHPGDSAAFRVIGVLIFLVGLLAPIAAGVVSPAPASASPTTVTRFPTANTQDANPWVNPANAYASDTINATATPLNNATKSGQWSGFGFDSVIPSGATISAVHILMEYRANSGSYRAESQAFYSGSACGSYGSDAPNGSLNVWDNDVTSCRSWAASDLNDANFAVWLGAYRFANPAVTFYLDSVSVSVTYVSSAAHVAPAASSVVNGNGFIFENDDEDQVGGDAADEDSQQNQGNGPITGVKIGERLNMRMEVSNGGTALPSTPASLFYDRNDNIWTKVRKGAPVVTDAGSCTADFNCTTVDSYNQVGSHSSLAYDPSGNPWIADYDANANGLRVARYVGTGGVGCDTDEWTCEAVYTDVTGEYTSIAFDKSGIPWISFRNMGDAQLMVAHYVGSGGTGCDSTDWTCQVIGSSGDEGYYTSIAIDPSNHPWISEWNNATGGLVVAHYVGTGGTGCDASVGATWKCEAVDTIGGGVGRYSHIAFDTSGAPWIAYNENNKGIVRVAHYVGSGGFGCDVAATPTWDCTSVESDYSGYGYSISLAMDPQGRPFISTYNDSTTELRIEQYVGSGGTGCSADAGAAWNCKTIDSTGDVGDYNSVAFDAAGHPWISYYDRTNGNLKVARYVTGVGSGTGCDAGASPDWKCSAIDSAGNVGQYTSIGFDADGRAGISYSDVSNHSLKFAQIARGGEIQVGNSLAHSTGDAIQESHWDMATSTDTTNRDDADCNGSGVHWNDGQFVESEEFNASIPDGSSTPQCTEYGFALDTSNALPSTHYRMTLAYKDAATSGRSLWRGFSSYYTGQDLTTASATAATVSKATIPAFAACSNASWGCDAVQTVGSVGDHISSAIDSQGTPWLSYSDTSNNGLVVAHYVGSGGSGCASARWQCSTIKTTGSGLSSSSIALDSHDAPWISYYDTDTGYLQVAHYVGSGGTGCAVAATPAWSCLVVDNAAYFANYTAITVGADGAPWLTYWDSSSNSVKVAHYVGTAGVGCAVSSWTCSALGEGYSSAIALDHSGNPWVSYYDTNGMNIAHYVGVGGANCLTSGWDCSVIESGLSLGDGSSVAVDGSNTVWVSYADSGTSGLRVAKYRGAAMDGSGCDTAAWDCETVASSTPVSFTSIAFDASGVPWIAYSSWSAGHLLVAKAVTTGSGSGCSGNSNWSCSTVDGASNVGGFAGIAFDLTGTPWISYANTGSGDALVARLLKSPSPLVASTGVTAGSRSAIRSDGPYPLDWGDTARPVSGSCNATAGFTGYCGVAAIDSDLDGITAKTNEVPIYSTSSKFATNTSSFTLSWTGRSSVAPSSSNLVFQVWRGGSTNAWQTFTLSTNTCSSTGASSDCTMTGTVSSSVSDYYRSKPDGSYWVDARISQPANTGGVETLSTNAVSIVPYNHAPDAPTSLVQKSSVNVTLATGYWFPGSNMRFDGMVSDVDAGDSLYLCVEVEPLGTSFTGTGETCGSASAGPGYPAITYLTVGNGAYHWQARTKDGGGLYSSWVSYDTNLETDLDFGSDTVKPTTGSVNDGLSSSVDASHNTGSLTTLSATWTGFADATSGIARYEYAIGTTSGATDTKGWTSAAAATTVTDSSLSLVLGQMYYVSVRAVDNANNTSNVVTSNGQTVLPLLVFNVTGVVSGAACGDTTTNIASTSSGFDFGLFTATTQHGIAGQSLSISTNAGSGYTVSVAQPTAISGSHTGHAFAGVSGTNAAPSVWPANGTEAFGYTTESNSLSGTAGRFHTSKWATPTSTPGEVMHKATSAVPTETDCVAFQASTSNLTPADSYSTTIVYTAVPNF